MNENKVIETLDYLFQKFGVVVDWSAENIAPKVEELMVKYCRYEIVTSVPETAMWIALLVFCIKLVQHGAKQIAEQKNGIWWSESYDEPTFGSTLIFVGLVVGGIVGAVGAVDSILNIVKWAVIPEMAFFEMLNKFVS